MAIEKHINIIGVAYSEMLLLPFIHCALESYKFCSPQEIKYVIGEAIME